MESEILTIQKLKDEYFKWATEKIQFSELDGCIEISTPFVDMYNDRITIYIVKIKNGYCLTDDGYTLDELSMLGIKFSGKYSKRRKTFDRILRNFGVKQSDNELTIDISSLEQYPGAQLRLVQCIIKVCDLLQTSREKVADLFYDDVANFFLDNGVQFSSDASFIGKTGNPNSFNFLVGKSKKKKEQAIQMVNNPSTTAYTSPLLSIIDVRELRPDTEFYVLANNETNTISDKFLAAFSNYNIVVLLWSEKMEWLSKFQVVA